MKRIKHTLVLLTLILVGLTAATAQTRKEKQAAKEAEIKKLLDAKTYTFVVQQVNPSRGGFWNISPSYYDLKIAQDTVVSYLPFFGRAYVAPMNPTEGGIKFTSIKNTYKEDIKSNGGREISIKPTDVKDVQNVYLSISLTGYATLRIINLNREPISFYGYIEKNKPAEKQE